MDYQFKSIEKKWQTYWAQHQTFKTSNQADKPKYYVLDMFPYPSGAGLHVGHPLGYIASDIFARYKRLKGFNVLHPMGYDSFGLPAEQYAIQTGQHPAITTEANIKRYREQLDNMGFSFDWSREVRTSDPDYYRWTQWIFMQIFNSWYNKDSDKAEAVDGLIKHFEASGSDNIHAVCDEEAQQFTADEWKAFTAEEQQQELLKYRLTYLRESTVNWCPALGTVLANDEVKDGFSERGGYPVEQKKMMQWSMRITAYAERLLQGLDTIDWPEPLKEMQRNWIGKSTGALVEFGSGEASIPVFTTRLDTIYGITFLVLAPEHDLVEQLTTDAQRSEVKTYIAQTKKKSELDRMAETKTVSGAFTGGYAIHPLTGAEIPVWIADYVLAGYGTGAVMAVPSGDQRDYLFAKKFNLPVIPILDTQQIETEADPTKEGLYINSDLINGLTYQEAIPVLISKLEELGAGSAKINYRMRDAVFGRQRYWGEPVPVYFNNGLPYLINEQDLPLVLPEIDKYLPTKTGEPPLARAEGWKYRPDFSGDAYEYELSTMPGWAGSSWYWYRYMASAEDRKKNVFAPEKAISYWKDVDLYIGGSEHATGHLLYSRFWNKFLKDRGYVVEEEPFKKLINQGMILGESQKMRISEKIHISGGKGYTTGSSYYLIDNELDYSFDNPERLLISQDVRSQMYKMDNEIIEILYSTSKHNVDIDLINPITHELDIERYINWRPEYKNAIFWCSGGCWNAGVFRPFENSNGEKRFFTQPEIEKMSKSKFNVVNPDDIIERYGADTLRLYEMFLGPLEQSKPWNTNGIEGVFKFLRKFWKLFHDDDFKFSVSDAEPAAAELKSLHKIIRKVEEDISRFSFNTSVSSFMICVNELTDLKCSNRHILQNLVIVLSPYAPHICEELWELLGNPPASLSYAGYPEFNPGYLVENEFAYPVSVNGKMRLNLNIPLSMEAAEVEQLVLNNADVQRYLEGKAPKKVIFVKGKIVNLVV